MLRSRLLGVSVLAISIGSIPVASAATARKGQLTGEVIACAVSGASKCSRVSATVAVYEAHRERLGRFVAKQHAGGGRFSFSLAPGLYVARASAVQTRLNGGTCVSSEVLVRPGKTASDVVRCSIKR